MVYIIPSLLLFSEQPCEGGEFSGLLSQEMWVATSSDCLEGDKTKELIAHSLLYSG